MSKGDIEHLIEETAVECGFIVYDCSVDVRGVNTKITVKIDSLNGIGHSECEAYSMKLAPKLEALPFYSLEVSSPGLNRELRCRDDFNRFAGAPVKIVFDDDGKRSTVKGRIKQVSENTLFLIKAIDGHKKEKIKNIKNKKQEIESEIEISLEHVVRAKLDY